MTPLPSYPKTGCPMCKPATRGSCQRCGASFDAILDPAVRMSGYEAHSYDHQHFQELDGKMALAPVLQALCLDCYRIDFASVYPDLPIPV